MPAPALDRTNSLDHLGQVAGVDEAGRGALAGPVAAAAVVLPSHWELPGLTDSKKISPNKRARLAAKIRDCAVSFSVAFVSEAEIDRINILQASLSAMAEAVSRLAVPLDHVLVDGDQCPDMPYPVTPIIGGDAQVACISAASILAKETRDAWMRQCGVWDPRYLFEQHKGYPTPDHLQRLEKFGPCRQHRMSYAPVQGALRQQDS